MQKSAAERRRMRNRESALASRKRKQERLEYLESENVRLSLQNRDLVEKLASSERTTLELVKRLEDIERIINRVSNESNKKRKMIESDGYFKEGFEEESRVLGWVGIGNGDGPELVSDDLMEKSESAVLEESSPLFCSSDSNWHHVLPCGQAKVEEFLPATPVVAAVSLHLTILFLTSQQNYY
jgi:hypothetical protein